MKFVQLFFVFFFILAGCSSHAEKKNQQQFCNDLSIQVLGAGGPEIDDGLASSSFIIWKNGKAKVLVDAGGGSSFNFEKSGAKFNDISTLLFTHFHVDHSAAIPVYVKAGYFTHRQSTLAVYGPRQGGGFPSTKEFINALFSDEQASVYPYLSDNIRQQSSTDFLIESHTIDSENSIWSKQLKDDITISAINVHHGDIPALAWRISTRNCAITFSGDMNTSTNNLSALAKNSNILVANNAIAEDANKFAKQLHMTPSQIGGIADKAKVENLILTHFMNRTIKRKNETVEFIKKNYSGNIILSEELMTY